MRDRVVTKVFCECGKRLGSVVATSEGLMFDHAHPQPNVPARGSTFGVFAWCPHHKRWLVLPTLETRGTAPKVIVSLAHGIARSSEALEEAEREANMEAAAALGKDEDALPPEWNSW